jgi:hypothetical protein
MAGLVFPAPAFSQDPLYVPSEPSTVFSGGVQYLITTRDAKIENSDAFIVGPDASLASFGAADFDYQSGVQAFLSASRDGVRLEGIFSDYGVWNSVGSGSLTDGLAFDEGLGGGWAGANSIDLTTPFIGLHSATAAGLGGEPDESEGLGPNSSFADTPPTYETLYKSRLQSFELNLLSENPDGAIRFGVGYRNLQLDELAGVAFTGLLRAEDAIGPNDGISHLALTTAGGLTFLGGTPDGFEDEVGNASGTPDTLTLLNEAKTSNNLNGIQAIFQEEIMYWRRLTVDGVIKAGVYHNDAKGTVSERYTGTDLSVGGDSSTYGSSLTDSRSSLAFVGTVGIQSELELDDHWSLIGGYDMIFVHGVALAPDQYSAVQGGVYDIDTHGQIIAHGASAGLQFRY